LPGILFNTEDGGNTFKTSGSFQTPRHYNAEDPYPSSETSVDYQQTTWHYIPEDGTHQVQSRFPQKLCISQNIIKGHFHLSVNQQVAWWSP
jgi:hypothetical protein